MNYTEAVDFLYSQLPMFSRIGKAAYKKDLTNTLHLCALLDHPEKNFKSIHIAGTNGKGSTSHMLAAVLQNNGYKTGLYTSPHLKDFRERIRINGTMISKDDVTDFVNRYKEEVVKIGCSFFEWSVGLAFNHFAKENVDIAVIETGLGGRLDSTNVIMPLISVITNISYDHADMLGETLPKIAAEKAGIIKANVPVVIGESNIDPEVNQVFLEKGRECQSTVFFADHNYHVVHSYFSLYQSEFTIEAPEQKLVTIKCDLPGYYQEKNIITVLRCIDVLNNSGITLDEEKSRDAFSKVKSTTGLHGRWEVLSEKPLTIADVAHNEAGLRYVLDQLQKFSFDKFHFVLGLVKEKDLNQILSLFPKDANYYFCCPDIPRGLEANILKQKANEMGLQGEAYESVDEAYHSSLKHASDNDLIYVGGSTFVVAEVI